MNSNYENDCNKHLIGNGNVNTIYLFLIDEERFDHDDDGDGELTTKRGRVSHVCMYVCMCVCVCVCVCVRVCVRV